MKIGFEPEKILLFSKNSLLQTLITGIIFIYYFTISEFPETAYHTLHTFFITTLVITLLVSIYFRIMTTSLTVLVMYISYIIVSNMRYNYGEDYIFSASYNIWSILFLPNLLLVWFLFQNNTKNKYWSLFCIFLLLQTAFIERLQNHSIDADSYYFYKHIGMLNYPAFSISILCLTILFIIYIAKGKILCCASFLSALVAFCAMYLSDNLLAFCLFFFGAILVEFISMLYYLNYIRLKDEELNIPNFNAYTRDADNKFPLKYSIALMYVDDYNRLLKRFGYNKIILLKKMFINRIRKVNQDVQIYNYKKDALILAFKNMNAQECFEKTEDIRRSLVKSIFVFNENNHLQLTVSQCVSEKKRSDINAAAVVERAETSLQKACSFTRNITIKA